LTLRRRGSYSPPVTRDTVEGSAPGRDPVADGGARRASATTGSGLPSALDEETARDLVLGGAVLGGGGGGSMAQGAELLRVALEIGRPRLLAVDALPDEALIVTVSAVGAPSAAEQDVRVADYADALRLLAERLDRPIAGLIASENGGFSSANGFVQSALSGIPVIDAPADGRAHPTGVMGSLGLDAVAGYVSRQAAVGGTPGARRVRLYVEGDLAAVDHVVRQGAVAAGGMVAVARNPASAAYVRAHAAPGALALAVRLGRLVRAHAPEGGEAVARALASALGGEVVATGLVRDVTLRSAGGYDVGSLRVADAEATFWNEYMTVDAGGRRRATFPDLVVTLDLRDGRPRGTAEVREGDPVALLVVPHRRLPLGAGVRLRQNLRPIEAAVGRPILAHLDGL
jgi:DUF917 family protein